MHPWMMEKMIVDRQQEMHGNLRRLPAAVGLPAVALGRRLTALRELLGWWLVELGLGLVASEERA